MKYELQHIQKWFYFIHFHQNGTYFDQPVTLKEESNAEETFARRQIREI